MAIMPTLRFKRDISLPMRQAHETPDLDMIRRIKAAFEILKPLLVARTPPQSRRRIKERCKRQKRIYIDLGQVEK